LIINLKKQLLMIPSILIYSRLVLGFVSIFLAVSQVNSFRLILVVLIVLGLISDILDGIIARKLNISTQKLRRMDSSVDQIFWLCCLLSAFLISKNFFQDHSIKLLILLSVEALTYLVSFIRFKKEVATHAISSKLWTLTIMSSLIQVILSGNSLMLFNICFWLGIVSRLEIIAILLIIKNWTNDVPSIYHAILLRQGKEIKRHKLLNG
jgi:phosphatidylglycerophosphate synthase